MSKMGKKRCLSQSKEVIEDGEESFINSSQSNEKFLE